MVRYDRISSLFWIAFSVACCVESIRLTLGSLSNPGPGFLPFIAGFAVGVLGIVLYLTTMQPAQKKTKVLWMPESQWAKLVAVPAGFLFYAFFLDQLGFKIMTFLLMWYFFQKIGDYGYKSAIFFAVITDFSVWLIFGYLLGIRFPRGILGL